MILAVVSDLIFVSRISEAAANVGVAIDVRQLAELAAAEDMPEAMIVDLTLGRGDPFELIREAKRRWPATKVIGFFPHVQVELKRQAEAAGADRVLPRSVFNEQLAGLLRELGGEV